MKARLSRESALLIAKYGTAVSLVMAVSAVIYLDGAVDISPGWLFIGFALGAIALCFLLALWVQPERYRLRNLAASFATVIALTAYLVGYHMATVKRPEVRLPYGTILTPKTGMTVTPGARLVIQGTARNLPDRSLLWLLSYDYGGDDYNIEQRLVLTSQGQWSGTATLGYKGEQKGSEEDVVVILVKDPALEDLLDEDYISDDYQDVPHALVDASTLCRAYYFVG
jgi:hypothetical protein